MHDGDAQGPGDLFMSARFRSALVVGGGSTAGEYPGNGGSFGTASNTSGGGRAMPLNVSYGSLVKLQQRYTAPCWLHSADARYPLYPSGKEGVGLISSHQQLVTCRPPQRAKKQEAEPQGSHIGAAPTEGSSGTAAAAAAAAADLGLGERGDWWEVVNVRDAAVATAIPPVPVLHGDPVAFKHNATGKMLNSHNVAAPLTHTHQEVTCYGNGDERVPVGHVGHRPRYDSWELQTLEQEHLQLQAGISSFKLVHVQTKTALQRTDKHLPSWGMHHTEVVTGANLNDVTGGWIISAHINDRLDAVLPPRAAANGGHDHANAVDAGGDGDKQHEQPPTSGTMSFWQKFAEVHARMITENNQLTGVHKYSSQADAWPFIHTGVLYWRGGKRGTKGNSTTTTTNSQIYLLGNPVVWFGTAIAVVLFAIIGGVRAIRQQRRMAPPLASTRQLDAYSRACFWLGLGWVAHYLPFLLMNRRLFLHHYLPAVCFGAMCISVLLEHAVLHSFGAPRVWAVLAWIVGLAAAASFGHLAPLAYGMPTTNEALGTMELRASWNIPRFKV